MESFLSTWHKAAVTTTGLFWMALWAFGLGYLISSMIQVFVTEKRMKETMGEAGAKSVGLGAFFGFISSSCSFAALSTTRALFAKGAGLIPSLAFLLASTNLVIELGIVISLFLSWQFVVGEYVGGALLILFMALLVKLSAKDSLIKEARERAKEQEENDQDKGDNDWKDKIQSFEGWKQVFNRYLMEWKMVWKDVSIGFTVAGIIAAFVPKSFFETLFVGAGKGEINFMEAFLQTLVGPIAAFFTFIGSMGNIPLAAVLFGNGVSFAGIMAFIFSDLVVLPVLRIQAKYYGWKMALYVLGIFLIILVAASLALHYGFSTFEMLPDPSNAKNVTEREFFKVDYTFFLNMGFIAFSGYCLFLKLRKDGLSSSNSSKLSEKVLFVMSIICYVWLIIGLFL